MSIQLRAGAEMFGCTKIKQLQMKLARTAAIEMKLLSDFARRVNSVIAPAEIRGSINAYHGSTLLVVKLKILSC